MSNKRNEKRCADCDFYNEEDDLARAICEIHGWCVDAGGDCDSFKLKEGLEWDNETNSI